MALKNILMIFNENRIGLDIIWNTTLNFFILISNNDMSSITEENLDIHTLLFAWYLFILKCHDYLPKDIEKKVLIYIIDG